MTAACRLWDPESGASRRTLEGDSAAVLSVAFSPDGRSLASGGSNGAVRIWDLESGTSRRTLEGHLAGVLSFAFSPDGRSLASGGSDGTVRIWDLESGILLATLCAGAEGWVAFTPTGRYKVSGAVAHFSGTRLACAGLNPGSLTRFSLPVR